jgi:class 3 adenylate cyclase/CHASE2 domain-containing sensor protein
LILFDDETERRMGSERFRPAGYAAVLGGVLGAGATTAGLDLIPYYIDRKDLAELGRVCLLYRGRIVLIGHLTSSGRTGKTGVVIPPGEIAAVAGFENIALATLTRDTDGIARAQSIFPVPVQAFGLREWPFFAALLAEKRCGRRVENGTFGSIPVPVMGGGDNRMLINYTGPGGTVFPTYSFWDVLSRVKAGDSAYLKDRFAHRVVLIGLGDKSDMDIVDTPLSLLLSPGLPGSFAGGMGSSMLGIEVHANTLNTLLTGAFLRRATAAQNLIILFVVCIASALFLSRLTTLGGAIAASALLSIGWLLASVGAFTVFDTWIDMAAPILGIILAWGSTSSYRFGVAEGQRRFIKRLFGRYVSPAVMEHLLKSPDQLVLGATGSRRVTVLFSDINRFSTVCENRPPDEIIRMLNDYFSAMTPIVFHHGGTIKQFVGDEIMALFGAPDPHPEHERAAVAAALEMTEALEEMRQRDGGRNMGFYSIKVGIHTGDVIVGNVGSLERTEYAAVGDNINLGSRIMGLAKELGARILISGETYERVCDMAGVEFIFRGEQDVRGRHEKVQVWEARRAPKEV